MQSFQEAFTCELSSLGDAVFLLTVTLAGTCPFTHLPYVCIADIWARAYLHCQGSHVLLNMRQVGTRFNDSPTAYSSTLWSDLQFGPSDVSVESDSEECYDLENDSALEVYAESDKPTFGLDSIDV